VAVGLALATGLLGLSVPIATGLLTNDVIPASNLPKLIEMGILLLLLSGVLLLLLLLLTVQITALRIEGWAGTRNQEAIMNRLLRLPRRVLAIQVLQKAAGGAMISSLLTGTLSLLSLGLMLWYSPPLALVALRLLVLPAGVMLLLG
jgi:ABC-type bacteriocin/lantibiotic exporter with double-glycine peptidase domain